MTRSITLFLFLLTPFLVNGAEGIATKTQSMEKFNGFVTCYWDKNSAEIYLEIADFETDLLFITSVSEGLGSNDIGIDRGRLDKQRLVYFKRAGNKVLLIEPNNYFRAVSDNIFEQKAVRESFARSVLWGFNIEAETNTKVLINLTPFLLSDEQFISRWLADLEQGTFVIDPTRSALNIDRTKNFPLNSEFDALLTFTGSNPGNLIKSVVPSPEAITINQHFSFIKLPDDNFKMRAYDPRSGFYNIAYYDYATPISEALEKRFIVRHRLHKEFPEKEIGPVIEPIVYYVDNGAPEPILSALLEGASWWAEAFEAAGFENAFQVKILPENADPMDVRYNVIQWVHRSTRGWSYGNSVFDPRTGEILKGHVSLGSLRVRQDFLIACGLLAPFEDGKVLPADMEAMALARLRQLSAHEVGHTLGLMHNFAASYNNRASVMDYPHPLIKITADNDLDLSNAYDNKIGSWDKITIRYGYQQFASEASEKEGLEKIIQEYISGGYKFISDEDARPQGGAHPFAHLWDNGTNAAKDLEHMLKVRQIALTHFSDRVIASGKPYSDMEHVLVPIYLLHRYAVEAASKLIGGLDYSYALKNDGQVIAAFMDSDLQIVAFRILLKTLAADQLILDEKLLQLLAPHPPGFARSNEDFPSQTGITFDPLSAAASAIQITMSQIFHPHRVARLIQYNQRNNNNPLLDNLYSMYFQNIFETSFKKGLMGEIQRLVQDLSIDNLIALERNTASAGYVKSWAFNRLADLDEWTAERKGIDHFSYLNHKLKSFLQNPTDHVTLLPPLIPPGSPIGSPENFGCGL